MPFTEMSIVDRRGEFCRLALKPGANVRELCRTVRCGVEAQEVDDLVWAAGSGCTGPIATLESYVP
jgi:hypothetical protein